MEIFVKHYHELTLDELYEILQLRNEVFIVEQNCPYQDIDQKDKHALHIIIKDNEGIQAYLRVLEKGVSFDEVGIGRVLAKKRRCGLGTMILKAGIQAAKDIYHADTILIEAQTYARSLYEKQGFVQTSEEFLEVDIPHIQMTLKAK